VSGLQRTGCLPSSPAERERGNKNIIHNINQRIYSVFCHAARLLHVPRRGKSHIPAHLMAYCIKSMSKDIIVHKIPPSSRQDTKPTDTKTLMHIRRNKSNVTTTQRKKR